MGLVKQRGQHIAVQSSGIIIIHAYNTCTDVILYYVHQRYDCTIDVMFFMLILSICFVAYMHIIIIYIIIIQCLQLVRIRPYLYGIYVHCTDIRKLRFIIRKTSSRRAPVHPRPRDVRDYARPLPRGVSAAAAVRSLVSVVMVCRNLQMRATRVSLRSS